MGAYEFLLAVHIVCAVVWVGGGAAIQVLAIRAQRSDDPVRLTTIAGEAEWIGTRIFVPTSLILLATGIALVETINVSYTDLWVLIGLGGFAFSFLVGSIYLGPESGRLKALAEAKGQGDPEFQTRRDRLLVVSRVELAILFIVVIDMAVKPGF